MTNTLIKTVATTIASTMILATTAYAEQPVETDGFEAHRAQMADVVSFELAGLTDTKVADLVSGEATDMDALAGFQVAQAFQNDADETAPVVVAKYDVYTVNAD